MSKNNNGIQDDVLKYNSDIQQVRSMFYFRGYNYNTFQDVKFDALFTCDKIILLVDLLTQFNENSKINIIVSNKQMLYLIKFLL